MSIECIIAKLANLGTELLLKSKNNFDEVLFQSIVELVYNYVFLQDLGPAFRGIDYQEIKNLVYPVILSEKI